MRLYDELFKTDKIKIKIVDLLKSMDKDGLAYIYIHLDIDDNDELDVFDKSKAPLPLETFRSLKKDIRVKKLKKDLMINNIISYMKDSDIYGDGWFSVEALDSPQKAIIYGDFYIYFYSFISQECLGDISKISNSDELSEYICEKVFMTKDSDSMEYRFLKSICFLRLAEPIAEFDEIDLDMEGFQKLMMVCVYNNYTMTIDKLIFEYNNIKSHDKSEISKLKQQLQEKANKVKELSDNVKALSKENKLISKMCDIGNVGDSLKSIQDNLIKLNSLEENLTNEFRANKKEIIRTTYENQIDRLTNQIVELKTALSCKTSDYKDIRKEFDDYKNDLEENFIKHVKENGLSLKMKQFIAETIGVDAEAVSSGQNVDEEGFKLFEEAIDEIGEKAEIKIGYVTVEDNCHMINFQDGSKSELNGLFDKVYISDYQFVLVDGDNKIIKTLSSKYEDNGISIRNLKLGIVYAFEPLRVQTPQGNVVIDDVKMLNSKFKLDQVVGLNDRNEIVRAFKGVKFSIDSMINSVKAKGHKPYFVLKVFSSGLYVRDVETGAEDMKVFDLNGMNILEGATIFEKDGEVKNAISMSKFYTASSYYKDKLVYGCVKRIEEDKFIVDKSNGESVIVKNVPQNCVLDDGTVIAVDEFNNFLFVSSHDDLYFEKKVLNKKPKQIVGDSDKYLEKLDIKGEVTIVGNVGRRNAYTLAFAQIGYRVKMLDGNATDIQKLIKTAKNSEGVIVVNSFCSHRIYWDSKTAYKSGKFGEAVYISGQDDGANALVRKFLEGLSQRESLTNEMIVEN